MAGRTRGFAKKRVRDLMTTKFPKTSATEKVGDVRRALEGRTFDEAGHVYVLDAKGAFLGQVPIEWVLRAEPNVPIGELKPVRPIEVREDDPAEAAALTAVTRH